MAVIERVRPEVARVARTVRPGLQRVWGPPGCGKTHWLMERARALLLDEGLPPERLGIAAFSRDAADNARARLVEATGLPAERLPYVKGIHQLCLELWRQQRPYSKAASEGDQLEQFFAELDVAWSRFVDVGEDAEDDDIREGNWALAFWDWQRATGRVTDDEDRLTELIEQFPLQPPGGQDAWSAVGLWKLVVPAYEAWKQELDRWDFTDLLQHAVREARAGRGLGVDALLVDEVQDMGPLLWAVCDGWALSTRYAAFAGDPNQAIYEFLGASPEQFMDHQGTLVQLEQSHRVTGRTIALAKQVLRRGGGLSEFPWLGLEQAPLAGDGSRAYLARTNKLVTRKGYELQDDGEPFWRLVRSPISKLNPLGRPEAGRLAALLRMGSAIGSIAARTLYDLVRHDVPTHGFSEGRWVTRGTQARLQRLSKSSPEHAILVGELESLGFTPEFREAVSKQQPWPAVEAMDARLLRYYRAVFEKHGLAGLADPPKLTLSTIHKAKGREWDQVEILLDWGKRPYAALVGEDQAARAAEHRVLYVAVTRSRSFPELLAEGLDTEFEL